MPVTDRYLLPALSLFGFACIASSRLSMPSRRFGLMQRFCGSVLNVVSREMDMLRTAVVFV
jgi:hypothetical protein